MGGIKMNFKGSSILSAGLVFNQRLSVRHFKAIFLYKVVLKRGNQW